MFNAPIDICSVPGLHRGETTYCSIEKRREKASTFINYDDDEENKN